MQKTDEEGDRNDVHSQEGEDFFRLGEDGIFQAIEGVDSRERRGLGDRTQINALGGVYGSNEFVAGKAKRIPADGVVSNRPRQRHDQKRSHRHQPGYASRMEVKKRETKPAHKNPECRAVRENHESKDRPGGEKEHQGGDKIVALFHGFEREPAGGGKQEQKEHLRQTRERKLPHQIAEKHDGAAQQGNEPVKKTACHMIPNPH